MQTNKNIKKKLAFKKNSALRLLITATLQLPWNQGWYADSDSDSDSTLREKFFDANANADSDSDSD